MKKILWLALFVLCISSFASAATRLEFPGAFYGDASPSGAYAVNIPGVGVKTHLGTFPVPGGDSILFVRMTEVGEFKFAGQSQTGRGTWEWTQSKGYTLLTTLACGVSPVIYDLQGVLHISNCSIGSQGWRFVTDAGVLMTGDQTYADAARNVWEWSTYLDLTIGQGGNGGAVAIRPGDRRVIEPGDCRFIRVAHIGTKFSAAINEFPLHRLVILVFDESELVNFPKDTTIAPTPAPVPTPTPTPAPSVKPAAVQVNAFTLTKAANLPDGTVFELVDPNNPQLGTRIRAWVQNGSIFFSIDYPGAGVGLLGQTGAQRPVR